MAATLILRVKPCQHETLSVTLATLRLALEYAIEDSEDKEALIYTLENLNRLQAALERAETKRKKQKRG